MTSRELSFVEEAGRRIDMGYRAPRAVAPRREVLKALELKEGERVLDVGSGPGLLVSDMARAVGVNGRVCGIEISEAMLALSRKRCAGQPWVEFEQADATTVPYRNGSFDAVVSTQVYAYLPDTPVALAELYRVLRPGGRIVIVDTDYDSLVMHTENQARMNRVLAAWHEHFVHGSLQRVLTAQLRDIGFTIRQRDVIPMSRPEYHSNTYSHEMISLIASFVVDSKGVPQEEAGAWAAEFRELGKQGRYFFSLNRHLCVAEKPRAP